MERAVSMEEISDGKLYGLEDMVKADCQDCKGCNACCQGMGSSILLDPYDVCRLTNGLGRSFESLLSKSIVYDRVSESINDGDVESLSLGECHGTRVVREKNRFLLIHNNVINTPISTADHSAIFLSDGSSNASNCRLERERTHSAPR